MVSFTRAHSARFYNVVVVFRSLIPCCEVRSTINYINVQGHLAVGDCDEELKATSFVPHNQCGGSQDFRRICVCVCLSRDTFEVKRVTENEEFMTCLGDPGYIRIYLMLDSHSYNIEVTRSKNN